MLTNLSTGRRILFTAILALCIVSLYAQQHPPNVFLMNPSTLSAAQESYGKPHSEFKAAIDALLIEANSALKAEPVSVMQKKDTPPSGDKHDYLSVGPYWWPDSTKPGGIPYIRRDGERNPEYYTFGDHLRKGQMVSNVNTLALAYCVTLQEKYAQKAIELLKVWFIDPATRMNPNLNFAQAIRGLNNGRGIGIIETYEFRDLIDAIQLLKESRHWTETMNRGMKEWFAAYLKWLQESPNGKDESGQKNNHGSAYDVQVASIALYLGKNDLARKTILGVPAKRIAVQVMVDGSQPLELARTKSWGYSLMNTEALINLALLGEHVGVDLWHYADQEGRGIQKAIDFLLPYALGEKPWAWKQIVPLDRDRMYPVLRFAALKYGDAKYQKAADALMSPDVARSRAILVLPRGK